MIHIALVGFVPLALLLFLQLPARRAVLVCYIGGWLFLPQSGYAVAGFPTYDKYSAIAIGTLLGVLLSDNGTILRYRPTLIDLPMALFCFWPAASHLYNGSGPTTAMNWTLVHLFQWGVPYLLGRVYFSDREGLRALAIGVFMGGLVYAPLVWFEVRVSPKLNLLVYGMSFRAGGFAQHMRYGGFRPLVFMQHGLMVALWMAVTTIVGLWLWRSKTLVRLGPLPMTWLVPFMMFTTVACKSANGVVALGLGTAALVATSLTRRFAVIVVLALVPPTYILVRTTGIWDGESLVAMIAQFDKERAGSLGIRMYQEEVYTAQAMKQPLFGWVNGRMIPLDEQGKRIVRGNDAFWIITFGLYGLVSLISIFTVLAAAPIAAVWRQRLAGITPETGPALGLAVIVILFAVDCLVNGMIIPVFSMSAGALAGGTASALVATQRPQRMAARVAAMRARPLDV